MGLEKEQRPMPRSGRRLVLMRMGKRNGATKFIREIKTKGTHIYFVQTGGVDMGVI